MGIFSEEKIKEIQLAIFLNRICAIQETQKIELIEELNTNIVESNLDNNPKIFCTYHLGSYRAILAVLVKNNVNFVLLIDANTYAKQAESITGLLFSIKIYFKSQSMIKLVDVENKNGIAESQKFIRLNYSIVAYIDGNSGGKGVYHLNKALMNPVTFLKGKLYVRTGISAISYLTNIDIIPVVSYRPKAKASSPVVEFLPPIQPYRTMCTLREYMQSTTQRLYKILESYLTIYFDQWEPWFYVHKYIDQEEMSFQFNPVDLQRIRFQFNAHRYSLFKIDQESFLFDRRTYHTYPLESKIYECLAKINLTCDSNYKDIINPNLLEDLLYKNVLI